MFSLYKTKIGQWLRDCSCTPQFWMDFDVLYQIKAHETKYYFQVKSAKLILYYYANVRLTHI